MLASAMANLDGRRDPSGERNDPSTLSEQNGSREDGPADLLAEATFQHKAETPEGSVGSTLAATPSERNGDGGDGSMSNPTVVPEGNYSGPIVNFSGVSQTNKANSEEPREKKVSCLTCREAKVKCVTDEGEAKCRRCIKLEVECRIEGHRRGRRKGKIKQHQVNRRFELIARTLEELRTLTKSLQDAPSIALIASIRYQLLSSTCINQETRKILLSATSSAATTLQGDTDSKGKKRVPDTGDQEGDTSSNDEFASNADSYGGYASVLGGGDAACGAISMIGSEVQSKSTVPGPRPPPGACSHFSGLEQHQGLTVSVGQDKVPLSLANPKHEHRQSLYPSRSGMMHRASALAETSRASKSASLLVEIEDYESVAIVPQAVQTLSNPLKLLAHASDAVDSVSRYGHPLSRNDPPEEVLQQSIDPSDNHGEGRSPSMATSAGAGSGMRHRSRSTSAAQSRRHGEAGGVALSPPSAQRHVEPHSRAPIEDNELVPLHRRLNQSIDQREAAAWSHFVGDADSHPATPARKKKRLALNKSSFDDIAGPGRPIDSSSNRKSQSRGHKIEWSSYFSRGAFHPRYDSGPSIDPIERKLLTVEQAQKLLSNFYEHFGTFVHCFDPNLSTLSYLRKHSSFLVSVICCIAAEYHPDTEYYGVHIRLAEYVDEMLPSIMSGVYKSVEISQACYLLACYQQMADSAVHDQTWALLGTSLRIASELGCNLACFSYSVPEGDPALEKHHRQLKNTERLWLSLWTFEKTIASQTGQRLHLAEDPIIAACGTWHQRPYALQQDEALVALVDLRRIMDRHASTFHTHILRALTSRSNKDGAGPHSQKRPSGHSEQVMLLVDLFRANANIDFKRWEESWLAVSEHWGSPASVLQSTGVLHLHFARLVILSLPLRSTSDMPTKDLDSLRRDCYSAAIGFLSFFIDRSERGLLPRLPNTMTISAVYCAIFALKLCGLSPDVAPYIETARIVKLARRLAGELRKAGSIPLHRLRTSVQARFAEYLVGYLVRWESHHLPRLSEMPTHGGAGQESGNLAEAERAKAFHRRSSLGDVSIGLPLGSMSPPTRRRRQAADDQMLSIVDSEAPEPSASRYNHSQHVSFTASSQPSRRGFSSQPFYPNSLPYASPVPSEAVGNPQPDSRNVRSELFAPLGSDTSLDEFWQSMMTSGGIVDSMTGFDALLDQMSGFNIPGTESQGGVGDFVGHGAAGSATQPTLGQQHISFGAPSIVMTEQQQHRSLNL